jgi:Lipid A 3-O-deacylase (PagL)
MFLIVFRSNSCFTAPITLFACSIGWRMSSVVSTRQSYATKVDGSNRRIGFFPSNKETLTRFFLFAALLTSAASAPAQNETSPPMQIYAGYSWLSNSFNGVPGSQKALNGWNGGAVFQPWHHLHFKLDYSMYRGTNAGAPQHPFFIMGGGQYEAAIHRERFYAEALVGEGGLNGNWFIGNSTGYLHGNTGSTASLAEFLGGGIDTPISHHAAIRVEGGVQHTGFSPLRPLSEGTYPYRLDGIPNYFARFSVGMVWLPRLGSEIRPSPEASTRTPPESEIIFEGLQSFGHFKIFAGPGSSYFSNGCIEYDRNSWGRFIGARLDYSADIMPVIFLSQRSKTDEWGNPMSATYETFPGVGIAPIGMRLLWRDGKRFKPYFVAKGGMTGYTRKAFSQNASYEEFSLQQAIGLQLKLTDRWDFRAGLEYFHQSNGFAVPSNPGLDAMTYRGGLSYHLSRARAAN